MVAQDGDLTLIRRLRPAMIAHFGADGLLDQLQDAAHRRTGLSWPKPLDHEGAGSEGLVQYTLITDAEGRAILEAAIGPLSAPVPGPDGEPDSRTAQRRRAEALVGMLQRATEAGDRVPSVTKTQLLLTINAADLAAGSEAGEVLGSLDTGLLLGTETVRRLTCDAAITPIVISDDGNLLHLGPTKRLFSSSQLKALWLRDKHCTFPGCQAPAYWCDAHHIVHWSDGGPTDLDNAALLCGHHHTLVHQRRLTARAGPAGKPQWDTTHGSYDRALTAQRSSGDPPG